MRRLGCLEKLALFVTVLLALVACDRLHISFNSGIELPDVGTTPPPTDNGSCPSGTVPEPVGNDQHCALLGTITDDLILTAGNIYQLQGAVRIGVDVGADGSAAAGDPATISIEPGVVIYGSSVGDLMVVSRGSQIEAQGTELAPIVFTSAHDLGFAEELGLPGQRFAFDGAVLEEPFTAEWGGLVINGLASLNTCNGNGICEADGEGDTGFYGGGDDGDSSGTLRYVQIRYAGNPIRADDELNGLSLQGVGSGTVLEYIQVHNSADDGIKILGGTAQLKYIAITGADDDGLDWTMGWRGKAQHVVVIQNPNQPSSDQGIEGDNFEDGNDFLPRSQPQLANMTLVGAGKRSGESDVGILLREGTGANIINSVVSGFGDACLDIDHDSTFIAAGGSATELSGGLTIDSTLLGQDCAEVFQSDSNLFELDAFFNNQANNVVGTTSLSNLFINGAAENLVMAVDPSLRFDGFFDSTGYAGAVRSPAAEDNWTLNWTHGLNPAPECPVGTFEDANGACVLAGTYTSDLTLVSGLDYILDGRVVIGADLGPDPANLWASGAAASLTIEPGVTVQGADTGSYLIISRGSKIYSNGTLSAPVTFTGYMPDTLNLDTTTAAWGGIVINGRATLNTCNGVGICEADGEGDSGLYGGVDDMDDSGQLFYTRVLYAGNPIAANDELNGISFQGVGAGTEVDYLQVHNSADDGIQFFGGTVQAKHLVVTGADDDGIAWTQGWRGKIQYIVIVQNLNQLNSDQGIEGENNGAGNDFLPRSQPQIANATIVGAANAGGESEQGILLREGTGANIFNSVVAGFGDACLDIDQDSTFAASGGSATNLTGVLTMQSTMLSTSCEEIFSETGGDPFSVQAWFQGQANNTVTTDTLIEDPGAAAYKRYVSGSAELGVTATDVSTVSSFFDAVTFIGAVEENQNNWTLGWTVWLNSQ